MGGKRTGSGQLSRSSEAIEGRQSIDQIAQQRAQRIAILGDVGQGVNLGSPIAILEAKGHITAEQASAGAEIERMFDQLFGRPHPKVPGAATPGKTVSLEAQDKREKFTRARYERVWDILSWLNDDAAKMVRFVCCGGRELPIWAGYQATMTIDPERGHLVAARGKDRKVIGAMKAQLPPLRLGLQAVADAGIMSVRKGGR